MQPVAKGLLRNKRRRAKENKQTCLKKPVRIFPDGLLLLHSIQSAWSKILLQINVFAFFQTAFDFRRNVRHFRVHGKAKPIECFHRRFAFAPFDRA